MEESKQILMSLSRMEENLKNLNTNVSNFSKVSELALQTDASVKSAHNRLDDAKTDTEKKFAEQKKDYEEKIAAECKAREKIEGNITWLWRAIGTGAIGFVFSIILILINTFGG